MNFGIFLEQNADGDGAWWQMLANGLGWTLATAFFAAIIAFFLGSALGVARTTSRTWLVRLGNAYVELFRNIPLIVQFFVWYFVVPGLIPAVKVWVVTLDPTTHQFVTAVVCLGLFTASRISEQVRSGIQALPRGQRYAGMAVGFTTWQTYRHVLLPNAFRIIIPPLTSETMNIFKNSSVAFAVSVTELTMFAMQAQEETGRGIEIYLAVTGLYIVSAFAINRIMTFIEKRVRVPGLAAPSAAGGH